MAAVVAPEERAVALTALGETHGRLRLLDAGAVRQMRESLERHGQLMAVAAYRPGDGGGGPLEVVDGFKRVHAARGLGWGELRVRVLPVDAVEAKVAMGVLNHGRGLSELEEAWLVRALHREDALTQPQIGRLLGRHKSWVSRRLLLAEGLDEAVQADVRLGLVAASTATAVARLPRCNQLAAAEAVMRRGLTRHQTERLITEVLARPAAERELALCESAERFPLLGDGPATGRRHGSERTPAQSLMADIGTLARIAARVQARLWERPLSALGEPAARLVADGLAGLDPVLTALSRTIARAVTADPRAQGHVEDAPRA